MKRILLFIICLFMFPIGAKAAEYKISELNMTVDIPNNYLVITRDNYKNNSGLEALGITEETMSSIFKTYNIYLDAYDISTGKEFFVIVNSIVGDYSKYTVEELEAIIPTLKEYYMSLNAYNVTIDIVNVNGVNYFRIDYVQGGVYLLNYYLVYGNNGYNFQIQSDTPLSASDKKSYEKIIDSLSFEATKNAAGASNNDKKSASNSKLISIIGATIGVVAGTIIGVIISSKKKKDNNNCSNCGLSLNADNKFCPNCGTKN